MGIPNGYLDTGAILYVERTCIKDDGLRERNGHDLATRTP